MKELQRFLFIFNSEITCLTKGTFKGTVVTDSQSNICHYPISTHKCVFIIHLTYLCVWLPVFYFSKCFKTAICFTAAVGIISVHITSIYIAVAHWVNSV